MAEIQVHSCVSTIIKNTSGRTMVCSFLPPHGRTLAAGESIEIVGDVWSQLGGKNSNRKRNAFLNALDNLDLEITQTPNPVFIDETTGNSKILTLHGGSAQYDAACYDHSSVSE
jgi:hypothetical protein